MHAYFLKNSQIYYTLKYLKKIQGTTNKFKDPQIFLKNFNITKNSFDTP